jgi:hypothetical protein
MAYSLLDGTSANIDVQVATSGSTPNKSLKCFLSTMSYAFRRGTTSKTTFCSTGWVDVVPNSKQLFGVFSGFASVGGPLSDPLSMFGLQTALPFTGTFETGSSLSGNLVVTEDANTLVAMANSGRGISWESSGVVSSTWVVV